MVLTTELAVNAVGSVIVTLDALVHELASVIVTVYVPAATPVIEAVVAALLQAKVYGAVPPEPLAVADPSLTPLQLMLVFTVLAVSAVGSVMITFDALVHELASDTVTV